MKQLAFALALLLVACAPAPKTGSVNQRATQFYTNTMLFYMNAR